ncbi:hypothetical protein [Rhodoflexus sp.]
MLSQLIDQREHRGWAFLFQAYRVNAIVVFVLSGLPAKTFGLFKIERENGKIAINTLLYLFYGKFLRPKKCLAGLCTYVVECVVLSLAVDVQKNYHHQSLKWHKT